ncbi:MAG: HEPN family nuclease [Nitrospirales bacterium]
MGNYTDLESEFIERTIKLIDQYTGLCEKFSFDEQYNYTLTINCLLGLIVMPKERVVSYIPTKRLTNAFKKEIGLIQSVIKPEIKTLRELIESLRHAVAHFDINVVSENDSKLIDYIEFKDTEVDVVIASFRGNELFAFLQYYSTCLLENLRRHQY